MENATNTVGWVLQVRLYGDEPIEWYPHTNLMLADGSNVRTGYIESIYYQGLDALVKCSREECLNHYPPKYVGTKKEKRFCSQSCKSKSWRKEKVVVNS